VTIDLSSIDTGNPKRDDHLRSATVLDVERFPTATFEAATRAYPAEAQVLAGNLAMHGQSEPVELHVMRVDSDTSIAESTTYSATGRLSRSAVGVGRWHGWGLVIADTVRLALTTNEMPITASTKGNAKQ